MAEKSKAHYEFKKQVDALEKFQGRGTELISVYVTPKYPVAEISGKLRDEAGQAANIKSATTRKNVLAALEKILQYLKTFREPPDNGIAIFCGNVSENEGRIDIELYSVIPPTPLKVQFYRCESKFVLEPLKELLEQTGTYGLVAIDGKDATIALLQGTSVKVIRRLHSTAHAKFKKGGQSAARFGRIREEEIEVYYKRVGEAMDAFLGQKNFGGVIVGGPGPVKEDFLKSASHNYQIKILGSVDTGYADEYGIEEIIEKSKDILAEQEAVKENQLIDDFKKQIVKDGLAAYGYEDIKEALLANKVSRLLVAENLGIQAAEYKCPKCGKTKLVIVREGEEAPKEEECSCGGKMQLVDSKNIAEELIEIAENAGLPVEMISRESAVGAQFLGMFHGIGAFLRYK
ncbi:MAG: peptide chain release factor aRF-1 [Candidatus Micrarchaeia archaeon]|jgi:peptide chain release factor subunit 1